MLWKPSLPRWKPLRALILLTILVLTWYLYFGRQHVEPPATIDNVEPASPQPKPVTKPKTLPCLALPGSKDVVVVLKTSAAELEQRLPDLLASTLKCFPNYLIYSDYTEEHKGQPVIDALENVSPKIKASHPDFDLYRRLQKGGPEALADEETRSADNTSRKLDKWKMLPIISRAYATYGLDKKWFVFIDMKSHFFQSNLLTWLNSLDPEEPYFMNIQGSQGESAMLLDSGSFVLSRPAIEAIAKEYTSKQAAYEQLTNERATGHSVLRQIVEKARSRTKSLQLTKSWPMFHQYKPSVINYGEITFFERLWCYPTIFHEGLTTAEITELWGFEQQWIVNHPGRVMKHGDIFTEYIVPQLSARSGKIDDWDNFSGADGEGTAAASIDDCMPLCADSSVCAQYTYLNGRCILSDVPRLGSAKMGVQSRWMLERVHRFAEKVAVCKGDETWD